MVSANLYDVIRRPIITEKSTIIAEAGKYVFEIADYADKTMTKKAIEQLFSVKVKKVNVMNVKGKNKRFKGTKGFSSGFKKALVTLEAGSNLDFSGGIK